MVALSDAGGGGRGAGEDGGSVSKGGTDALREGRMAEKEVRRLRGY